MKKLPIFLLFTCFFVLISCTPKNDDDFLTKEFPADWIKFESNKLIVCYPDSLSIDTTFHELDFILRSKRHTKDDFSDNFGFSVHDYEYTSYEEMKGSLLHEVKDLLEEVQIQNVHMVQINNREYFKIKGYGKYFNQLISFEQYAIVIDSQVYLFNFTGLKEDEKTYFPVFRTILENIQLSK